MKKNLLSANEALQTKRCKPDSRSVQLTNLWPARSARLTGWREGFLCFNAAGDRCLSAEQRRFLAAGEEGSPERSSPSGIDRRLTGWLWGEKKDSSPGWTETNSDLSFQNKIILRPSQNVAWPMNLVVAGSAQYAHVQSFFLFVCLFLTRKYHKNVTKSINLSIHHLSVHHLSI